MDAILGFFNNPLFLTIVPVGWGLICKYHPAWKNFPNAAIPYVTLVMAFLTKLGAPADAHASFIPIGIVAGPLGAALGAGWQAILNSLLYETFLRHPLGAVLKKA